MTALSPVKTLEIRPMAFNPMRRPSFSAAERLADDFLIPAVRPGAAQSQWTLQIPPFGKVNAKEQRPVVLAGNSIE